MKRTYHVSILTGREWTVEESFNIYEDALHAARTLAPQYLTKITRMGLTLWMGGR